MDVIIKIRKEGIRRKFSPFTIQSYIYHVQDFLLYCKKSFKEISKKDVKEYLEQQALMGKSGSTLNVKLSAIKFMLQVQGKKWNLDLKFSRKPNKIPVVLTKSEIKNLLKSVKNEQHWLIIALLYAAGLRLSEIRNLKIKDLEIKEGYGWVRKGKGSRDRMFIIANKLKPILQNFVKNLEREDYVISINKMPIGRSTIYRIVKDYAKKSKIKKNVHPHTLRHTFATHVVENGYDLNSLQRLLGHTNASTTQVYIHSSVPKIQVISPFDTI